MLMFALLSVIDDTASRYEELLILTAANKANKAAPGCHFCSDNIVQYAAGETAARGFCPRSHSPKMKNMREDSRGGVDTSLTHFHCNLYTVHLH